MTKSERDSLCVGEKTDTQTSYFLWVGKGQSERATVLENCRNKINREEKAKRQNKKKEIL